ncbi:histidine phosphatase family protein [Granulicoccus sp. GXG6511]|uniref:histidine phosphatase family protein n=1 Tax=Granulicoccus sp. GXG6511 TaxID=3381351 RepID=UPI003D7CA467
MGQVAAGRRIVLWRHGRTAWNVENRAQGQSDVPMDEFGHEQARAAAPILAKFEPVALWSSDLRRATETAAYLVEATGLPVQTDTRLREYAVGLRQGYTFNEFKAAHPEVHRRFFSDPDYHVPGAEEMPEVRARMAAALWDIAGALTPGETAIIVGHGASLTAGLLGFFDAPSALREMFAGMDNCAWAILHEHPARGWQLTGYNLDSVGGPRQLASGENADSPAARRAR